MKKLIRLLALALFAIGFQACSNDKDSELDGNHRLDGEEKPVVYKFKLALGGDYVEQSEEPLSRAENSSYVGINVTRTEKGTTSQEKYAYGVFTIKSDIEIDLVSGYTYDFEATVLTDNTDALYYDNSSKGYPEPFVIWEKEITDRNYIKNLYPREHLEDFQYTYDLTKYPTEDTKNALYDLKYGRAKVNINGNKYIVNTCEYPRVDRFYGTKTGVDPLALPESGEIEIKVDYKCFGIEIDASSIPQGTTLSWVDITKGRDNDGVSNELLQFPENLKLSSESEDTSIWSEVYSLNNMLGDGTESYTFRFTWDKEGKKETFDQTFQVRAKYKKILKIIISGEANIHTTGNIKITETGKNMTPEDPLIVQPQQE